ncbi:hypothetical protein [Paraburkholderia elongata]|uniref:Uncharacterized protein n=1 Tax=Paraburkholderia elongata TaxID=2675747 RepID=A0A972NVB3_9BURK|nr:hypothetical protein [Paraburkholderia elongata]NPT58295.1 hypothetical protein [Paraburkholderia elongata]
MAGSMTGVLFGMITLIMAAISVAEHYRHAHPRNQQFRWLDTHPMRDWLHHKR